MVMRLPFASFTRTVLVPPVEELRASAAVIAETADSSLCLQHKLEELDTEELHLGLLMVPSQPRMVAAAAESAWASLSNDMVTGSSGPGGSLRRKTSTIPGTYGREVTDQMSVCVWAKIIVVKYKIWRK